MTRRLIREYSFRATPERLWAALTDPARLATWLLPGDFVAQVGHRCRFQGIGPLGVPDTIECQVLAVDPGRRLSLRWTSARDASASIVTWTVIPRRDGTRLRIEHREAAPAAVGAAEADAGGLEASSDLGAGAAAAGAAHAVPAAGGWDALVAQLQDRLRDPCEPRRAA